MKKEKTKGEPKLKKIFGKKKIVGLAGNKNEGKTNNLTHLIIDFRKYNKETPVYVFGLPRTVTEKLKEKYKVIELSSLKQIKRKENCILIIDEFQKLKLNNKRNKDELDELVDLIYHRNAYVIFSSPNIREFNSIIGSKIERWLLKTIYAEDCINGSQLKKIINEYQGNYKHGNMISVPKNELLLINEEQDETINCPYEEIADSKKELKSIF